MAQATRYWAAGLFRGVTAILAGSGVLLLPVIAQPDLHYSKLSPSVLCLVSFLAIDAVIVATTAWQAGHSRHQRVVLRLQAVAGIAVAASLLAMVCVQAPMTWMLSVATVPALLSAMIALATAACPAAEQRITGCYISAALSLVAASLLLAGAWMGAGLAMRSINLYLCLVGIDLIVLSMNMLAEDDHALAVQTSVR